MKQFLHFRKIALAVVFGFGSLVASAQAPAIQWDKTFGGNTADDLMALCQTTDGGYILGGYSNSGISGDKTVASKGGNDYWVLKLNSNGVKQWDKSFGGTGHDYLKSIIQTSDGGYMLGGFSDSGISGDKSQASKGNSDYWIVKMDAAGNKLWDKTFGGNHLDYLLSLDQTSDGGYILGGYSFSGISGDKSQASNGLHDYWVVRLDSNGNIIWDRTFGGDKEDYLETSIQTYDGGFILAGDSFSGISGNKTQALEGGSDYWVIKLDANGNKIWDKSFGGNTLDYLNGLVKTADGGYLLGGYSWSGISGSKSQSSKGSADYWVIKLSSFGDKLWDKTFGGSLFDVLTSLSQTSDGSYILGGYSYSSISGDKSQSSRGDSDYWVVKLDAVGNKIWDKTIGSNAEEFSSKIIQTSDGGFLIGGHSGSGISNEKSQASQGGIDFWIVKLAGSPTGITEPTSSLNISISPNPSQGKFQLQLNNLTAKTADITISDLVSRTVYQQEIQVTGNQIQQEITLPAVKGMYLLQLKAGEQVSSRKIIIE